MIRRLVLGVGVGLLAALTWSTAAAQGNAPFFSSPYNSAEPLEKFLVFTAPPRADVPDGQVHWTDQEVPGIDTLGPDGAVYNICPEDGLAWSLEGGDPFGGGKFVAVECEGSATGWQFLAFHLCKVGIGFSIDDAHRNYTRVAPGEVVGYECPDDHSHLSLGYWAEASAKQDLPCPQWYVQQRYWVNAACLVQAGRLPPTLAWRLDLSEDWELRFLKPQILEPLQSASFLFVIVALLLYLLGVFFRTRTPHEINHSDWLTLDAILKSGIWWLGMVLVILISAGPFWAVGPGAISSYTVEDRPYQEMARLTGFSDWQLLKAFYMVAVPRDANGEPVGASEPGKIFPPEAAAAIPFGETNTEAWGTVNPTEPGPYGAYRAWDAVADRWPPSFYESVVLGLSVSREAQRQREGLIAIASNPALIDLARATGKTVRPQDLYGSSAGAVGRTQILPGHFAPGGLCGDAPSMDVWNDPQAVAECTTRYLATNGCWGRWWDNNDVWSALCSYNPGAWDRAVDQWYWDVLQDRMTRLSAASLAANVQRANIPRAVNTPTRETYVSTPILGLLITEALLQNGQSAYHFPGQINAWLVELGPQLRPHRAAVRGVYRVFRAWILIFYSPEKLLALGVQL